MAIAGSPPAQRFFTGGGLAGDLINSIDWSLTPLGPMSAWPGSLKTIVGTMLQSRHPMFLWWGPELIQFYNDAYLPSFGIGKHPAAMGQRGRDCWGEIWSIIGPQIDDVMNRGKASWNEDHLVPIFRNGRIEEVYWTYGYSPVSDEAGRIAGTLVVCTETTPRVIADRRLNAIRRLSDATSACDDFGSIADEALKVVEASAFDIPFALLYRADSSTGEFLLRSAVGVNYGSLAAVDAGLRPCLGTVKTGLAARAGPLVLPEHVGVGGGPWSESSTHAVVCSPKSASVGTFVFGLSPRLPFDSAYQQFFGDFMAQLERSAARVEAWLVLERTNAERQRLLGELESASRAKDDFLATVSHELRTPLTAMLGWARMLRGADTDPARIQKGLAVIERNAKVQAQLIDDILDVSRIVAGKVRLSMRRVGAASVIKAAVETMRPTATAREVDIRFDCDADLGDLVADEDRVQQIIWNLLSNAVKFTPRGGEVVVDAERLGSEMKIRVRDNGKGISPSFLPRVFDRFRQDDASTTKQQAGLGLGLSIVRHLVELHGGGVVARSEGEGRGATFEVTLPIQAVEPRDSGAPGSRESVLPRPSDDGAKHPLSGVSVLVVDDQQDARDLVATVLEDAGAVVRQADSGSAALRLLSDTNFQVIVSDLGMPGGDGNTLLQRIRSNASPPHRLVPALALTAYARSEDRDRAFAAGFQEYSAKPIDPDRLVALVAGLVRRHGRSL